MRLNPETLSGSFTDVPQGFDQSMRRAFAQIHSECAQKPPVRRARRLSFGTALLIALLLAAIAVAATLLSHSVFEMTMGATPENGARITQYNLAKQSFGECDVEIREAAYDGMSLYVVYSIRDRSADGLLGEADENGVRYLGGTSMPAMERDDIGWWCDHLWIDGKSVDMPNMSGGETIGGDANGEILYYMMYRLDQVDLYLDGKSVEIAMPIGKRQALDSLVYHEETGLLDMPKAGLIAFRLDCSLREGVTTERPNIVLDAPDFTAKVSEAVYTPIQLYLTLDTQVKPAAMDAFIAENGEGFYDEQGKLLWPYTGLDVIESWSMNLALVDAAGKPVFERMEGFYGCQGAGAERAWYTFPYREDYPREMYLAPTLPVGGADMTRAVRVR